ncbi:MAG: hypothetical protein J5829_01675 [Lachnospiraceae bacterium]|nr:hypothetical protein [Lachnospiraceae bacterium]
MNDEGKQIRKLEDDLNVSGTGVILMGLWSIIRVTMQVFEESGKIINEVIAEDQTVSKPLVVIVLVVLLGILGFIVMNIHLYIGLNAVRAARGKKYKKGYFRAAIIVGLLAVSGMGSYWDELQDLENIDTNLAAMLVDITTIYIFAVIIISTVKLEKLRGKET